MLFLAQNSLNIAALATMLPSNLPKQPGEAWNSPSAKKRLQDLDPGLAMCLSYVVGSGWDLVGGVCSLEFC